MKYFTRLVIVLLTLILSGCTTSVEIINNSFNSFVYKPDEAVIIVGAYGELKVGNVYAQTNKGKVTFSVPTTISEKIDAFAWKIKVGESFQVTRANLNDGTLLQVNFKDNHTINITRPGIYYYGTIMTKGRRALVKKEIIPPVISKARVKYRDVFKKLKPVNFK